MMRLLLYGLQSSGASLFAYFLAQVPDSVAVIDLWARRRRGLFRGTTPVAPRIESTGPVVVKCAVTSTVSWEQHVASFRPDRTILFLRDPLATAASLQRKPYRRHGGSIDAKLSLIERLHRKRDGFDAVVHYEDFVDDRAGTVARIACLGWRSEPGHYGLPRGLDEVVRFARSSSVWCDENFGTLWDTGNIRPGAIEAAPPEGDHTEQDRERIERLCPTLWAAYEDRRLKEGA